MVRFVALAFLEHWALIIPTLISHFQQNDHPTLLNVVAHVDIDISPF
jgi:hypothetical protein